MHERSAAEKGENADAGREHKGAGLVRGQDKARAASGGAAWLRREGNADGLGGFVDVYSPQKRSKALPAAPSKSPGPGLKPVQPPYARALLTRFVQAGASWEIMKVTFP